MPTNCTVCIHPERAQIDKKLVDSVPLRRIIAVHGGTSVTSLQRHKRAHLASSLTKAKAAEEVASADSLLERIEWLIESCKGIADRANKAKQWQSATSALRECRCNLALLAELSGQLRTPQPGAPVNGGVVNVGVGVRIENGSNGNGNNDDPAITGAEAQSKIIELCRTDRFAEWMKHCLYEAGRREIYFPLEEMTDEDLIKRLNANWELRTRVRLCLVKASLGCIDEVRSENPPHTGEDGTLIRQMKTSA
jgi:hypothetical protein